MSDSSSSSFSYSSSQSASGRRLTLTPYWQSNYEENVHTSFSFRIVVTAENMPAEIFRWLRKPSQSVYGGDSDEWDGICSGDDLEDLGIDEPLSESNPPRFRTSVFNGIVKSRSLAMLLWAGLKTEAETLVESLDDGDVLEQGDPFTVTGAT